MSTVEPDFPHTSPVLGTGAPFVDAFSGPAVYTFLVKLSPDGHLLYSVLLGGNKTPVSGAAIALGKEAQTIGSAISVDGSGVVTIAGENATEFSCYCVAAFRHTCVCLDVETAGFVARISAGGNSLVWAITSEPHRPVFLRRITWSAVDNAGSRQASRWMVFPRLPESFNLAPFTGTRGRPEQQRVVVAKVSADGSTLIYSTYLGGSTGSKFNGLVLDTSGNLWVGGSSSSADLPSVGKRAFFLVMTLSISASSMAIHCSAGCIASTGNLYCCLIAANAVRTYYGVPGLSGYRRRDPLVPGDLDNGKSSSFQVVLNTT